MTYAKQIRLSLGTLALLITATVLYAVFRQTGGAKPGPLFSFSQIPDSILLYQVHDTVKLMRSAAGWTVNGMPADETRITLLLAAMEQSVVRRPAAQNQADSLARILEKAGVRVEVYGGASKPVAFRITGNESRMKTFVQRQAGEVVEVTIPGYRVFVAGIFLLPETEWINRRIFNFNWRNFQSLSAEFPGHPADSFTVAFNGKFFSIPGMPTDTARLNTYLDEISLLEADGFLPSHQLPDTLASAGCAGIIKITTVSGRELSLQLFPAGNRLLGITGYLPAAWFSGNKTTLLTRRRTWFRQGGQ